MMTEASILRRSRWPVLLLALWAVLCQWLVSPLPPPERAAGEREDQWALPRLSDQAARKDALQTLQRIRPWPGEAGRGKGASPNEPLPWNFYGVMAQDGQQFALIGSDDNLGRFVKGDILPNGETLVAINNDSIEVRIREGVQTVTLYRQPERFRPTEAPVVQPRSGGKEVLPGNLKKQKQKKAEKPVNDNRGHPGK